MNAQPVAYIRRSVARRGDPGDVSREFQTSKVRDLANGDGPTLRIVDADWGRSAATDNTDRRLAFLALLEEIERGEVSTLYAFSADRLARSVEWAARLLNACRRAGSTIVTGEGRFAPGDAGAVMLFQMLAVMNENALSVMTTKARASVGTRRRRGDVLGQRPYGEVRTRKDGVVVGRAEDTALIVATFREAGSYFAAARLLNERKVPTRNGAKWYARTVQRIINRADKATAPTGHRRGVRSFGSRLFSGLLRCHCRAVMGQTISGEGTPRYRCPIGASDPSHLRPYMVNEARLLAAMKDEAAHLSVPYDAVEIPADDERAALEETHDRWIEQYGERLIDKATRDARLADVDARLAALDEAQSLVDVPQSIDWTITETNTAAAVNAVLRALWERVELGPDLMPVRFAWRRPEWRA